MTHPNLRSPAAVLLVLACAFAPAVSAAGEPGGATPEQVFELALAANEEGDMSTLLTLVAPGERGMVLLDLFDMGAMACTQSPDEVAPLCKVFAEAGLDDQYEAALAGAEAESELPFEPRQTHRLERAATLFAEVDIPALGEKLMAAVEELRGPTGDELFTWDRLDAVEIDGDRAVGREEGRQDELRFVRVDDRWFLTWRGLM